MKNFLFSISFLFIFISNAFTQKETPNLPFDKTTNKITYSEVILVDSLTTKQELFSRAREWFAKTYKSSTNVIQMEDKESGKIVGKALMQVYHKQFGMIGESGYINYTISLYLKDGKYKYEITNFYHSGQFTSAGGRIPDYGVCEDMINTTDRQMGFSYQKIYNYYLNQMNDNITELVVDLKRAMITNAVSSQNDW